VTLCLPGQKDLDSCAFAFLAFDGDRSLVPLNDFSNNGKAETRSLVLGGKKGVEDKLQVFLSDPATRSGSSRESAPFLDLDVMVPPFSIAETH
jgi:hypothetical protein